MHGESGSLDGDPTTYEPFMRSGTFKGNHPLDLCRQAIDFWRDYLNRIEQALNSGTGPPRP